MMDIDEEAWESMAMVREWETVARDLSGLVRYYRGKRGMTQTQLGELIGRSQRYISELEDPEKRKGLPSTEILRELFLVLRPQPDEFLMAILGIDGIYRMPDLPPLPEGQVDNVVIATHTIEGINQMDLSEHAKQMLRDDLIRVWRRDEEERRRRGNA